MKSLPFASTQRPASPWPPAAFPFFSLLLFFTIHALPALAIGDKPPGFAPDTTGPACLPPPPVTIECHNLDPGLASYGFATADSAACVDTVTATASYADFDTVCHWGPILRTFQVLDCAGQSATCTQRVFVRHVQNFAVHFPDDLIVQDCNASGHYNEPTFYGIDCERLNVSYQDAFTADPPGACFQVDRTWTIVDWCAYDPNLPKISVPNPAPKVTLYHPLNLKGPVVSPPGTAAPWEPTVVKIKYNDPAPTDYSKFWNAGANGYTYKQFIAIMGNTSLVAVNCPDSALRFYDQTANNPYFWNSSGWWWWEKIGNRKDFFEMPVDLSASFKDACGGSNIKIGFTLDFDLNNDDLLETTVGSAYLQVPGLFYYNSKFNSIQFPTVFDSRPVPEDQKYRFVVQETVSDSIRTAHLRWSAPVAPDSFVVPELPYGKHRIKWYASDDHCFSIDTACEYYFVVQDGVPPTVVCRNGLSVNVLPTKQVELNANDFLQYAEDNWTPAVFIEKALRKPGTGTGFPYQADGIHPQTSVTFDCTQLGANPVELWAKDPWGNVDSCQTYVIVQDKNKNCDGPGASSIEGQLLTEDSLALEDANIRLDAAFPSGPPQILFQISNNQGRYGFYALPLLGDYSLAPEKDNDPLNGVSTFDLIQINKHILGQELLKSPYKMIAADADNSRSITTFDIVELRKLILGINTDLPNNNAWRFVDKSYKFPNPANPFQAIFPESTQIFGMKAKPQNQDFVAVKVGDVNGNAITGSLLSADDRSAGALLFDVTPAAPFPNGQVKAGDLVTLCFRAAEKVAGYQFTLYFPDLDLLELEPDAGMSAANFGIFKAGHALTCSFNAPAVSAAETPSEYTLTFRARAGGQIDNLLNVSSRITRAEAYRVNVSNDGMEKLEVALRYDWGNGPAVKGQGFELYQNRPNPWQSRTQIGFYLPEAGSATLTVFDETGRTLYTSKREFAKGNNAFLLDAAGLDAAAVLCYKLETAAGSAVKRMLRVK